MTSIFIEEISQIPYQEDEKSKGLFTILSDVKSVGYLNKEQFIEILKWKSPRPLKHYSSNSEEEIKLFTKLAFEHKNEKLKIHTLTALNGVNYPGASALLMFYDPNIYPVIDIRVWQQLYRVKLVKENQRGQNFTLNQWIEYLKIIRSISIKMKCQVRQVEKRIFDYDRLTRKTNLYI